MNKDAQLMSCRDYLELLEFDSNARVSMHLLDYTVLIKINIQ